MPTCPGAPTVDQSIPGRPTDEPSGLQRLAVTYPPAHAAAVPLETRDVSMSPWCWSLGRMQIFTRVSPACVCPGPCPPFASTSQRTTSFGCLDQDQPLSSLQYNAPRGRTSQADINASIPNLIIHCQDPARSPILVHPRSLLVSSFPFCASKIRHLPLTP